MNSVSKTLYIPLYGKALVSKMGLFLHDPKAEEIWQAEQFPLGGKAASKWLAYYMGIRSAVFDDWLREKLAEDGESTVLHIGCGMDSRVLRTEHQGHMWYDVDFPEVIDQRRRYFRESGTYRMVSGEASAAQWLNEVPEHKSAIVVMEGVSMYIDAEKLRALAAALCGHFEKVSLLMDCYSVFAAGMSRYKNPVNDVGVRGLYGLDEPKAVEAAGLRFVRQHEMCPARYTETLRGGEKLIFQKLYNGRSAKRLYKLFEYEKR